MERGDFGSRFYPNYSAVDETNLSIFMPPCASTPFRTINNVEDELFETSLPSSSKVLEISRLGKNSNSSSLDLEKSACEALESYRRAAEHRNLQEQLQKVELELLQHQLNAKSAEVMHPNIINERTQKLDKVISRLHILLESKKELTRYLMKTADEENFINLPYQYHESVQSLFSFCIEIMNNIEDIKQLVEKLSTVKYDRKLLQAALQGKGYLEEMQSLHKHIKGVYEKLKEMNQAKTNESCWKSR